MKIQGNNPFKDLLMKMQFSRAVLLKDLRILGTLSKEPVWEFLFWKNVILRNFFCNKWGHLTELVHCAQTSET